MRPRTIIFLAIAIALSFVSHSFDLQGDAAPFAKDGVSFERLQYHGTALLLLLGALGFFITAGFTLFRRNAISSDSRR